MKALAAIACLLALGTWARAGQVRVIVQWIEMPHAAMTAMLSEPQNTGPGLHANTMSLVKEGKAKVVDTNSIVTTEGAILESVAELIYPTEYDPPSIPVPSSLAPIARINPSERLATAFVTRNTGATLGFSWWKRLDTGTVSMQIELEHVSLQRLPTMRPFTDARGDASARMPIFETRRAKANLILSHGRYEMAGVFRPKENPPPPALETRVLVFVRADLLDD